MRDKANQIVTVGLANGDNLAMDVLDYIARIVLQIPDCMRKLPCTIESIVIANKMRNPVMLNATYRIPEDEGEVQQVGQ